LLVHLTNKLLGSVSACEIPLLKSDQEETDTKIVLYCNYAAEERFKYARMRSPNTDIFFILLYFAPRLNIKILFDTRTGNKHRLIDISKLAVDFTPTYCDALLGLHAFTRCDRPVPSKALEKLNPYNCCRRPLATMNSSRILENHGMSQRTLPWTAEVCLSDIQAKGHKDHRSGHTSTHNADEKCGNADGKLDHKKTIDLTSLPPPRVCLIGHIKRTIKLAWLENVTRAEPFHPSSGK